MAPVTHQQQLHLSQLRPLYLAQKVLGKHGTDRWKDGRTAGKTEAYMQVLVTKTAPSFPT